MLAQYVSEVLDLKYSRIVFRVDEGKPHLDVKSAIKITLRNEMPCS